MGGLSISQALLCTVVATTTTRLFGTRVTLLIGVCLQTLALIGASFAHQTWHLFLSQGLCFGFGIGFLFVGSVGIVPQWFTKRRSLANGVATAGSGMGGLMYSLATQAMIDSVGIAWAFRILGILAFTVNFTCAILMRDRNKSIGSRNIAFDYALLVRWEFLLTLGWGFLSMLGYVVLLFSLPNFAISIGFSPSQGALVGALLNLGQGLGRPTVGIFSDTVGRINIAGFTTLLTGILCFIIWIPAKTYAVLICFALLGGSVAGTFWTTVGPVAAEVVGLKDLPAALSIMWIVLAFPTTCEYSRLQTSHSSLMRCSRRANWVGPPASDRQHLPACSDFCRVHVCRRGDMHVALTDVEDWSTRTHSVRTGEGASRGRPHRSDCDSGD